jgi:hypothetical protein
LPLHAEFLESEPSRQPQISRPAIQQRHPTRRQRSRVWDIEFISQKAS